MASHMSERFACPAPLNYPEDRVLAGPSAASATSAVAKKQEINHHPVVMSIAR